MWENKIKIYLSRRTPSGMGVAMQRRAPESGEPHGRGLPSVCSPSPPPKKVVGRKLGEGATDPPPGNTPQRLLPELSVRCQGLASQASCLAPELWEGTWEGVKGEGCSGSPLDSDGGWQTPPPPQKISLQVHS